MSTITLQEAAKTNLADLIHRLAPGDEVMITENDKLVAKLVAAPERAKKPRQSGTLRGTVLSMEHFDDPLEEFEEYM